MFVVKNTENIKENLNELSEVTPLDCMLLFLKFSMPALRVAIGMWQLTILLILKSVSAWNFLIHSSLSSSHVCSDFCIGFCCWVVSLFLSIYVGSWTVGCPCGQPWVFWLVYHFFKFMEFLLSWSIQIVCLRFECLQTIMPSFGFFKESSNSSPKEMGVGVLSKLGQILVFTGHPR